MSTNEYIFCFVLFFVVACHIREKSAAAAAAAKTSTYSVKFPYRHQIKLSSNTCAYQWVCNVHTNEFISLIRHCTNTTDRYFFFSLCCCCCCCYTVVQANLHWSYCAIGCSHSASCMWFSFAHHYHGMRVMRTLQPQQNPLASPKKKHNLRIEEYEM